MRKQIKRFYKNLLGLLRRRSNGRFSVSLSLDEVRAGCCPDDSALLANFPDSRPTSFVILISLTLLGEESAMGDLSWGEFVLEFDLSSSVECTSFSDWFSRIVFVMSLTEQFFKFADRFSWEGLYKFFDKEINCFWFWCVEWVCEFALGEFSCSLCFSGFGIFTGKAFVVQLCLSRLQLLVNVDLQAEQVTGVVWW